MGWGHRAVPEEGAGAKGQRLALRMSVPRGDATPHSLIVFDPSFIGAAAPLQKVDTARQKPPTLLSGPCRDTHPGPPPLPGPH